MLDYLNYDDDEYITASDVMKEAEELTEELLKPTKEEIENGAI